MKNSLVVRVVSKGHVVVIALNIYLAASGAAIAKPSTVEAPTIPPGHERTEILNGGLQRGEVRTEKGVNVLGPCGGVRIDGTKLSKNSGAEGCTGSGTAATVSSAIAKPSNEAGKQDAAKDSVGVREDVFNHWWWIYAGAVALLIVWPCASDPWEGAKNPFLKREVDDIFVQ